MDQTHVEKIASDYLSRLVEKGVVEDSAFAVVFGAHAAGCGGSHDPIETVVVSERFGKDPIEEGRALWLETWQIDCRIKPCSASPGQWEAAHESPTLTRAKEHGIVVRL